MKRFPLFLFVTVFAALETADILSDLGISKEQAEEMIHYEQACNASNLWVCYFAINGGNHLKPSRSSIGIVVKNF